MLIFLIEINTFLPGLFVCRCFTSTEMIFLKHIIIFILIEQNLKKKKIPIIRRQICFRSSKSWLCSRIRNQERQESWIKIKGHKSCDQNKTEQKALRKYLNNFRLSILSITDYGFCKYPRTSWLLPCLN